MTSIRVRSPRRGRARTSPSRRSSTDGRDAVGGTERRGSGCRPRLGGVRSRDERGGGVPLDVELRGGFVLHPRREPRGRRARRAASRAPHMSEAPRTDRRLLRRRWGHAGHAHAHDDPDQVPVPEEPRQARGGPGGRGGGARGALAAPAAADGARAERAPREPRAEHENTPPPRRRRRPARRRPRRRRGRALRPVAAVLRRGGGDRRNGRGLWRTLGALAAPGRADPRHALEMGLAVHPRNPLVLEDLAETLLAVGDFGAQARRQPDQRPDPEARGAHEARAETLEPAEAFRAIAKRAKTADADADDAERGGSRASRNPPRAVEAEVELRPRRGRGRGRGRGREGSSSRRPLRSFPSRRASRRRACAPHVGRAPSVSPRPWRSRRRRRSRGAKPRRTRAIPRPLRRRATPPATPSGDSRTRLSRGADDAGRGVGRRPGLGRGRRFADSIRDSTLALLGARVRSSRPARTGASRRSRGRPIPPAPAGRTPKKPPGPPGPPPGAGSERPAPPTKGFLSRAGDVSGVRASSESTPSRLTGAATEAERRERAHREHQKAVAAETAAAAAAEWTPARRRAPGGSGAGRRCLGGGGVSRGGGSRRRRPRGGAF